MLSQVKISGPVEYGSSIVPDQRHAHANQLASKYVYKVESEIILTIMIKAKVLKYNFWSKTSGSRISCISRVTQFCP